jgi:phage-related protein
MAIRLDDFVANQMPGTQHDSQALGCEVRILVYGKRRGIYRILFSIVGDTVWVLRIRHGTRGSLPS